MNSEAKDEQVEQQQEGQEPVEQAGAPEGAAESAHSPEELHLMLADARNKADEHWNLALRAQAESENLRKRQEKALENAHKYALDRFVEALLPVRDSMELGLDAARDGSADVTRLREGMELTLKLLAGVMEKFNVVEVDPEGQPFDPEYHQAMSMQPRDDVPPHTVVTVVQKGYQLNGRLVRPAMVIVSSSSS